jgi:response regulator NasT
MPILPETDYWPVTFAGSINEAYRMMIGKSFDLVIVNAPLPDEFGSEFAIEAVKNDDTCILLIVANTLYEDTYYRMLPFGIITMSKPANLQMLAHNLRVLCVMRERLRKLRQKQITVEEKMEEIRVINRAKWELINRKNMTEPTAHQYIIQESMNRRMTKKAVAEEIINMMYEAGG